MSGSMANNHKRGQGSLWTVVPEGGKGDEGGGEGTAKIGMSLYLIIVHHTIK
jgi:hypothetical protein